MFKVVLTALQVLAMVLFAIAMGTIIICLMTILLSELVNTVIGYDIIHSLIRPLFH